MNPRTTTVVWVRKAADRLEALNARHPWNHNEHFHGWVLRRLPRGSRLVLDVGCGAGALLAELRAHLGPSGEIHGIDVDTTMARTAAARFAADPVVAVRHLAFDDVRSPGDVRSSEGLRAAAATGSPDTGRYDAVTMVAVLHHLDLTPALAHAKELLAPGGRLLVVGLARVGSPADVAVDVVSALLNPLVGLVKHPRRARPDDPGVDAPGMPVREPRHSFGDVIRAAREVLPGARGRRRLFFRYTLEWTRPR